ncbi:MAG: cysteine desulfurase family protein [Gemmatimonadota bacterium]
MKPIYLDHAATTPLRPEVRDAMLPYLDGRFGNPSSAHHFGREARAALESARERTAKALGALPSEIVFTAAGTEADNLAVLGRWRHQQSGAVICSAVEHKAVLKAALRARAEGAELVVLGVDGEGRVDPAVLDDVLPAMPCIVSVLWGNNEVGTLQPVDELAERCVEAGVHFHTDAVQAYGKVRVRVDETPCALLALSAHKFGGPKGAGLLFVRAGVALEPLVLGGGQEHGLRPGTENVAMAVATATAVELASAEQPHEEVRLASLRDALEQSLLDRIPGAAVNAAGAARLPHVLNLTVPGVDQEALLVALDLQGIAVSVASACQSGAAEPSHVLRAMDRVVEDAASIRLSVGRTSTEAEIAEAAAAIPEIVGRVRTST